MAIILRYPVSLHNATNQDMVVFDTLKFRLTADLVAEAIGIKNEGEMWFKKFPFTFDA